MGFVTLIGNVKAEGKRTDLFIVHVPTFPLEKTPRFHLELSSIWSAPVHYDVIGSYDLFFPLSSQIDPQKL